MILKFIDFYPACKKSEKINASYFGNIWDIFPLSLLTPVPINHQIIFSATSAFAMMKTELNSPLKNILLNERDLIDHSLELCEILQFEFVFHKPCQGLEEVLLSTLGDFRTKELLSSSEVITCSIY